MKTNDKHKLTKNNLTRKSYKTHISYFIFTKMFTLLQWNLNGFFKKLDELKIIITETQPEIICLQETNFIYDNSGKLPNYTGYSKYRTTVQEQVEG